MRINTDEVFGFLTTNLRLKNKNSTFFIQIAQIFGKFKTLA